VAYRPVDEPAEVSDSEFPGWASLPVLGRAATNFPAWTGLLGGPFPQGLQKEQLPLDVRRHLPPTLLKALHGLKRCPQKLGHLLLGLLQFPPESLKLFAVHIYPSFSGKGKKICSPRKILLDRLYHIVILKQGLFPFCQRFAKKSSLNFAVYGEKSIFYPDGRRGLL
jgi:hypothetical protein